jgi:hypothetical protein
MAQSRRSRRPAPPPADAGRPAFELDPSARLVACLRQAFPGFQPNDRWWIRVENKIKTTAWMIDPAGHDQFLAGYAQMRSDTLVDFLRVHGLIPAPPVDEYERLANDLSVAARKVLAALDEWNAYQAADHMARTSLEDRTGLSIAVLRRVMEDELPYVQPQLFASRCGPAGGYWLTPEGRLVAATIAKNILPAADASPPKAGIRRSRHA